MPSATRSGPDRAASRGSGGRPLAATARPIAAAAAVLALALGVLAARVVPALPSVFPAPGEVRLLGADAYTHLRHARFSVRHFPHVQRWDAGTHYPVGERSRHAGLLDLAVAAVARVRGASEGAPVERVAAWVPPILAALSVLALYGLGRAVGGPGLALGACAIFALHPGPSRSRTLLGFADHHAAEILLSLASAAALAAWLRARRRRATGALAAALPLALLWFTWIGAPILLGLVGVSIAVAGVLESGRGDDPRGGVRAAWGYGAALAALTGPVALLAPDLVLAPDWLGAWLAACALLAVGPVALAAGLGWTGDRPVRRAIAGAAILVAIAVGMSALATGPGAHVVDLVFRERTALVAEHVAVGVRRVLFELGAVAPLALAGGALVPLAVRRRRLPPAAAVPLVFGLGLLALWWRSHDLGYLVPGFAALLAALAAGAIVRATHGPGRTAARAAIAASLLAPLWPGGPVRAPAPGPEEVAGLVRAHEGWIEALEWMRTHTPQPTLPVDARVPPWPQRGLRYPAGTYGVMTPWDHGSFVAALGRRPPVHSQRISDHTARWLTGPPGAHALCPRCRGPETVRYVVLSARALADDFASKIAIARRPVERFRRVFALAKLGSERVPLVDYGEGYAASMAAHLYLRDARELDGYRLVFDSRDESFLVFEGTPRRVPGRPPGLLAQRRAYRVTGPEARAHFRRWLEAGLEREGSLLRYGGEFQPSVKVFEVVPGARLTGTAPPGATVRARVGLASETSGRRLEIARSAVADGGGHFEIAVPYPTAPSRATVATTGPWALFVDRGAQRPDHMVFLDVPETAVREGARVPVPPLGGG